ncbi:hypothetical protein LINPERHAP1_LOCUS2933, partial [Linum perenne]
KLKKLIWAIIEGGYILRPFQRGRFVCNGSNI